MPAPGGAARSASSFARAGPARGEVGLVQSRPTEHEEHQYQGFFRGLGATSKQPVCSKGRTPLKRLHEATHFAIGCEKWDEAGTRHTSTAHSNFVDPGIVFATVDAPDKNASAVELRQLEHQPGIHYRTEQRERYADPGPQPLDPQYRYPSTMHLGDDRPELRSQSCAAHARIPETEVHRAGALRAAGSGVLVPTSSWPKPVRCHPVSGGPRSVENYDLGVANQMRFGRLSANNSTIVHEANVRNPVLGHHVPLAALERPHARSTAALVDDANLSVPPLRTLGALRPHC